MNARPPPLCHLTFRCASHSCILADVLGGKPLLSLYCVRHAGLGPKRDTAKHASTYGEREQEETWRWLMGTGGVCTGTNGRPAKWLCKANRNDSTANQPNTDLLAITGECVLGQAPARRMAKFSLRAELPIRPGQWAAAQGLAWAKEGGASAMGRSRRVDSRVFNGGPWLTHVDGSPPLLYRPLGLCLLAFPPESNRGRGCTMQELRALSFGPQKYATPGTDFLRDAHVRPDRTCLHRRLQRPSWMHLLSYMPYSNGPGS